MYGRYTSLNDKCDKLFSNVVIQRDLGITIKEGVVIMKLDNDSFDIKL